MRVELTDLKLDYLLEAQVAGDLARKTVKP